MRAGKLDREIVIERATETVDSYGVPSSTWGTLANMRAEVIDATDDEVMRPSGASSEAAVVFRTRYLDGVTLADRITYSGQAFNIVQLKEVGRRRGLEIRATRIGP